MTQPISNILIVGAGWTGRQVAAQCAAHGVQTYLSDCLADRICEAFAWIGEHVQARIDEKNWSAESKATCKKKLHGIPNKDIHELEVDLVIECVPEQISSKKRVLRELSASFPAPTIIASNSSYFTPSMLSRFVEQPERFAHFHFHSPVWAASIVDIVPGPDANPEITERLEIFARQIGQTPIVQSVENPGYIFNWILQAMLKSSLELVDRQVATPEDIELSWKKITGMPLGPFGMMDLIGIDLIHQVLSNARWMGNYQETQRLIDVLQPWVDRGQLGVKTGQGFFDYDP